jgi:hypothetical protein
VGATTRSGTSSDVALDAENRLLDKRSRVFAEVAKTIPPNIVDALGVNLAELGRGPLEALV